jgi:hypothetical protein
MEKYAENEINTPKYRKIIRFSKTGKNMINGNKRKI